MYIVIILIEEYTNCILIITKLLYQFDPRDLLYLTDVFKRDETYPLSHCGTMPEHSNINMGELTSNTPSISRQNFLFQTRLSILKKN